MEDATVSPTHQQGIRVSPGIFAFATALLLAVLIHWEKNIKRVFAKQHGEFKGYHSLPGPTPFPLRFIGNAFILPSRRDLLKKMDELYMKYGPCYRLTLFNEDIVVLNTAPLAQALLGSNDLNHFRKGETYEIYFSGTEGLPVLAGEKWKTRRKMISDSFKYRALRRYNHNFNKHSEILLGDLEKLFEDQRVHTINDSVKQCIFKHSCEAIMGVDISGSEAGALFCKSLETYLHIIGERLIKPWLLIDSLWRRHPFQRKSTEMFQNMVKVITEVIQGYNNTGVSRDNASSSQEPPLRSNNKSNFQSMIEVMLNNGESDKTIFEEVAITLAVAHDTTSVAIQIALFMLALHPHHQDKCRSEVDAVFNDPIKYQDGNLRYEALAELKHLERCILESQRILSLASILMRKLEAPLKLQEGLVIPSGVMVYVFPSVIHKNPEYFPQPEQFDPDRFLPEHSIHRHPYAYLSFAAGPRSCLGMKLALVESKMVIAKIIRKFVVATPDKLSDTVIVPAVIPAPEKPINFRFELRK